MFSSAATKILKGLFSRAVPNYNGSEYADGVEDGEILRDRHGTPSCFASTENTVFFLNGVCQGQDRLWQLHISRMAASGRLCEIAGEKAMKVDVMVRQLGLRIRAIGDLEDIQAKALRGDSLSESVRVMLESFAKGVNWAAANCKQMPPEFWITGQRKWEAWTPVDSLAVMRLHGFAMCFGVQHQILRQAMFDILGEDVAKEWTRTCEDEKSLPLTVPPHDSEISEALSQTDIKTALGPQREKGLGSNWWVVSGDLSASKSPLLASDPHLAVKIPGFWYQINLHCNKGSGSGFVGAGCGAVGVPGIFIGHNAYAAWGITLGYCDVEDAILERVRRQGEKKYESLDDDGKWVEVNTRKEKIYIKGQKAPREILVLESIHGPIISHSSWQTYGSLAEMAAAKVNGDEGKGYKVMIAYRGLPLRSKSTGIVGVYSLLKAKSWDKFDTALSYISKVICLNFGYADIDGNIGYVLCGEGPVRNFEKGKEHFPLKGWSEEGRNDGWIPHKYLPKTLNPKKKYVISANHKLVDYSNYPIYLGQVFKAGFRAGSIEKALLELIEQKVAMTTEHMRMIQLSCLSLASVEFVSILRKTLTKEALEGMQSERSFSLADVEAGVEFLHNFDGNLTKDSKQATLYELCHSEVVKLLLPKIPDAVKDNGIAAELTRKIFTGKAFDDAKALKILNEFQGHMHINILRMLRSPESSASIQSNGGLCYVLAASLARAWGVFQRLPSKRWGANHTLTVAHPFTKALHFPAGKGLDGPIVEMGGDSNTPAQAATAGLDDLSNAGTCISLRFLADMSDLQNGCRLQTPVGICGVPSSPFYTNRTEGWAAGEVPTMVWEESQVRKAARYALRFDTRGGRKTEGASMLTYGVIGGAVACVVCAAHYLLH